MRRAACFLALFAGAGAHAAPRSPSFDVASQVAPSVPPPGPPRAPLVWTGALSGPGGMPVWIVERHGLPLVRLELSFDLTPIRAGLPPGALDALGAVWGEATQHIDTRDTFERLGADVSIGCGSLRCWGALEVPVEGLEASLARLGEVVRAPPLGTTALGATALARWRRASRREWRTDWLAPGIVHARALGRLAWPEGHAYRADRVQATFGVGSAAVREAWRSVVGGGAASLVVAGDVVPSDVLPRLEAAFGGLGGRASPLGVPRPSLPERRVLVDSPGANQALVTVSWDSPSLIHPDNHPYSLAFHALAGGFTSRLNLRLREAEGLTYRVDGASSADAPFGWSEVELAIDPIQVATVVAVLTEELERAGIAGFTEDEVAAARHHAWVQGAVEASTLAGLARTLWLDRRAGSPPGQAMTHLAKLEAVSVAEVNAAAAAWLVGPRSWLVSGDTAVIEPLLEQAGWITDTVWGACQAVYGGPCPR